MGTHKFPSYTQKKTDLWGFFLHTQKVFIPSNCVTKSESEVQKQYYLITEDEHLLAIIWEDRIHSHFLSSHQWEIHLQKIKACIDDVQKKR